jgi:hypothetical protein
MKRVVTALALSVAALAGAGAILSLVAPEAMAQVRAALVKNVDEPGRAPYHVYVEITQFNCFFGGCSNFGNFSGVILFDLPPVPAGKRLIITNVSGQLPSSSMENARIGFQSQQIISFQLVKWAFFGPFFLQFGGLGSFTAEANVNYGPGEQPHINLYLPSPTNYVGALHISGYFIDASN